jgi:hypothetical protein
VFALGYVPTTAGHPRRDGILVHRQRLPEQHVTAHRGIPVTTPIRTLLDLAAVASVSVLSRAFEQAQVHLHLPPAPLAAEVIARPRRRGNAKLRQILAGSVDPAAVRSVLELRFLRMCAAHGIARPRMNVRIGDWTPERRAVGRRCRPRRRRRCGAARAGEGAVRGGSGLIGSRGRAGPGVSTAH